MTVQADSPQTSMKLGELLRGLGCVSNEDLEAALAYKRERGMKLGQALVELRMIEETDLAKALRQQGKIFCINLSSKLVDRKVAQELGEGRSRQFEVIALNRIAGVVTVAMEDPADVYAVDQIAMCLNATVLAVHAEPARIRDCIDYGFSNGGSSSVDIEQIASDSLVASLRTDPEQRVEIEEPSESESLDRPVINMVRGVIEEAAQAGASDIHLEAHRDRLSVRFRVDGTLYERLSLPKSWNRPCLARLKVLSNMDIAQRRLPQDGRTQISIGDRRIDLRIATTPTLHGESAVIRLLDGGKNIFDIDDLGIDEAQRERLEHVISGRDGIVLATGPTGSGKTTTLYACLQQLHAPATKIITLEDPVENQLDGITQINTHAKAGLTFATGLRSILRQDPDVILVGEIRDPETAQIAVQAALTGHVVLSTLHTVGTAETVTRLVDLGLEPFLLADTLRGIIAQRLIRRLCTSCRKREKPNPGMLARLGLTEKDAAERDFYEAVGCGDCHMTGFSGRVAIYEIVRVTPEISSLISQGQDTTTLRQAFTDLGFTTLRQEGLRKMYEGVTTLHEVFGVTSRG